MFTKWLQRCFDKCLYSKHEDSAASKIRHIVKAGQRPVLQYLKIIHTRAWKPTITRGPLSMNKRTTTQHYLKNEVALMYWLTIRDKFRSILLKFHLCRIR